MIQYPRVPSNIYSYRPTIFGLPIRDVLVTAIISCFAILFSQLSVYISIAVILTVPALLLRKKSRTSTILAKIYNFLSRTERQLKIEYSYRNMNGFSYVSSGQWISSFFEVMCQDIMTMREDLQHMIFDEIRSVLDLSETQLDFYSISVPQEDLGRTPLAFRTFLRFTVHSRGDDAEKKILEMSREMDNLADRMENLGFLMERISDPDTLNLLLARLVHGPHRSLPGFRMGGPENKGDFISYRKHRNYIETEKFSADLLFTDSDYNSGPYYLTFLESMGIPLDIYTSIRKAGSGNPGKFLKSLIAERRAELRVAGTNSRNNNFLKKQLSDLERMINLYEKEKATPMDLITIIRIYADHPATLTDRIQRIRTSLEKIGIWTEDLPSTSASLSRFLNAGFQRKQAYLMSSVDVAHMIPLFREPYTGRSGILLGVDDLSERLHHYDPFRQNSHNILIIGETGSGKSYFAKLMVTRSINAGIVRTAIIFDPLNEYFCKYFNGRCSETHLEEFEGITDVSVEGKETDVIIVKARPEDIDDDGRLHRFLLKLNSDMMSNKPSEPRMIVIDECHIILRNNVNNKLLGSMVRHSRHFATSIVNVSQNTDDFINEKSGSVAFNSNRIFIFRTRNLRESHRKVLKLEGFSYEPPERLMGGNMHPYSECIVSDGEHCRKIRVISGTDEDLLLEN